MKCPCCEYEQKDTEHDYVDVEKIIKSGKRKGEIKIVQEWRVTAQPIGDELFDKITVVGIADNYLWGSATRDIEFMICPKCGVVFKDKGE